MAQYRWNVTETAAGYDAAATHIHPHYNEIQEKILQLLEFVGSDFLLVDAGGGSGRFVEKFLHRFPGTRAVLIDQSESFLALADTRLQEFGHRAVCHLARLQDDWFGIVDEPAAIVSMSAIHHLDPDEKRQFYNRSYSVLAPGGLLLNGDEVRPADGAAYLEQCKTWVAHMHNVMREGLVPEPMCDALRQWEERNVGQFGKPHSSGDDCHEAVEVQCGYLAASGFASVDVPWQKDLWAVLRAVKQ